MKKITLLTTGILCAASMAIGATAAGVFEKIEAELRPDFEIFYENAKQNFKNAAGEIVYPILYEGSTYLPVRAVSEMINKEVTWYEADKRIEIADAPVVTVTDADKIVTEDTIKQPDGKGGSAAGAVDRGEKPQGQQPERKPDKGDRYDDDRIVADATVSVEDAKKIVLEKAGANEAEVDRFEIDVDNNGTAYEIEFRYGDRRYESKVNVYSGEILEWEIDD